MIPQSYCWDDNSFYTHSEPCAIDPLESVNQKRDIYVVPANGCLDSPVFEEGKHPKRVNDTWVNVENHIGESGYVNGVPTTIEQYGSLPDGWSTTAPEPTLEDQLAAIEAEYAPKISALQTALVAATLTDGAIMDGNISSLRTEWVALLNAKSSAMEALLI